jgi:hypothetical protein
MTDKHPKRPRDLKGPFRRLRHNTAQSLIKVDMAAEAKMALIFFLTCDGVNRDGVNR